MSAGFRRREVVLAADEMRRYDPVEWHDAIVLVEHGEVELETVDGTRRRFSRGAVLCFAGLPVRVLRNAGPRQLLLVAISRGATDSFPTEVPSHSQ